MSSDRLYTVARQVARHGMLVCTRLKRNKTFAGSSGGGDSDSCAYDDAFRDMLIKKRRK